MRRSAFAVTLTIACFIALACTEPNMVPNVSITSPAESPEFNEGAAIFLRGTASDPEDGAVPNSMVSWSSSIDGAIGTGFSVVFREGTPADHTITMSATDSEGGVGSDEIHVRINPNQPPQVAIAEPLGDITVIQGTLLNFSANVSDPEDGTRANVAWSSDLDGTFANGAKVTHSGLSLGDHVITVTATDSRGLSATDQTNVSVLPNQSPVVTILAPADGSSFQFGDQITFTADATDAEDDSISDFRFFWLSGINGSLGSGRSIMRDDLAVGSHRITATVTDSHGASALDTIRIDVTAPPPQPGYNISLRFLTSVSATHEAVFDSARARWEAIIAGDVPDLQVTVGAGTCGSGSPPIDELIDDVIIFARVEAIDGQGGILGSAGPCLIRSSGNLTLAGSMRFDVDDLDFLTNLGLLDDVVLHEMAHVLGFGTLWNDFGLLSGGGGADPFFTGPLTIAAFDSVGGTAYMGNKVPVENTGGAGTRDGHWRESVFNNELMTGFIDQGVNPLSLVTIASFGDMTYVVDPTQADTYALPAPPPAPPPGGIRLVDDIWTLPIYRVYPDGRVVPVEN